MYRLFVAIDLPPAVKEKILKLCFGIPGARWADKDQLHLTLKFIGEVDGNIVDEVEEALSSIEAKSFSIILSGIGHFPPKKEPRVIWVGVQENEKLLGLHKKIDRCLTQIGIEPDQRKFHSHITLARLKGNLPLPKISLYMAEHSFFKTDPIGVKEFILFRSFLSPKGATYQKIAAYNLKDS